MRRRTYLGGLSVLLAGCLGTTRGSTAPRCPQFDSAADRVVCADASDADLPLEASQDELTTEPGDGTVETLPIRLTNRSSASFAPAAWRFERAVDGDWRSEIRGTASTDTVPSGESHVWAVSRETHPTTRNEDRTALAVGDIPDGDYAFAVVGTLGGERVETHARFELTTA